MQPHPAVFHCMLWCALMATSAQSRWQLSSQCLCSRHACKRIYRSFCRCECSDKSTTRQILACLDPSDAQQEQWKQQGGPQAERALGRKPIPRTLSVEESGRSSATLGTASAEEWLQQAAQEVEKDGDSPASRLQYQLIQGALPCKHPAKVAVQTLAGEV